MNIMLKVLDNLIVVGIFVIIALILTAILTLVFGNGIGFLLTFCLIGFYFVCEPIK